MEKLPFVMSTSLVLHDAVSLGLSQNKLSSVGVPWMGGGKPCLWLEPLPEFLRVMITQFSLDFWAAVVTEQGIRLSHSSCWWTREMGQSGYGPIIYDPLPLSYGPSRVCMPGTEAPPGQSLWGNTSLHQKSTSRLPVRV